MITDKLKLLALIAALLFSSGCQNEPKPTSTPDPYANLVQVSDGSGGLMWAPLYESIAPSNFDSSDFYRDGAFISYSGSDYKALRGIDVSYYQADIDWERVRADGVEFAMIRCGYRGYTEGEIFEDEKFRDNVRGACAAGVEVGIYFFSQAVNAREAEEEAEFTLSLIQGMDISFPVAFDWEYIGGGNEARTDDLDGAMLTDCALAFCKKIQDAGYEPMVYFYRPLAYHKYELDRLAGIKFWAGAAGDFPDFYYDHYIWQYSYTGSVDGIDHPVDLNICFINTFS